jgi:uncharacterized membrane protein YhdT
MATSFFMLSLGLLGVDVLLRTWTPLAAKLPGNALYLLLAYVPLFVFPHLSAWALWGSLLFLASYSLFNYARMVGLTGEPRFFAAAAVGVVAHFAAAQTHWYHLFTAMPAFTIAFVMAVAASRQDAPAFLQRLCLSWLGMLVYGYLAGHGALFDDLVTHPVVLTGGAWLSVVIFLAKCADVLWVGVQKVKSDAPWLQLVVCPAGGVAGAVALAATGGFPVGEFAALGLVVGLGLGTASRGYLLIVLDVVGKAPDRPKKGTMLFGFAFALALAYHFIRFFYTGEGPVMTGS